MPNYLILSGHDFRTPRWANMHFIAQELARRGKTRFFSVGFSALSKLRGDPRLMLDARANRVEEFKGVECYLWKTTWHPFNLKLPMLRGVSSQLFKLYRHGMPERFRRWVEDSDVIVVESGMQPILMGLIREINPRARTIYIVSDLLETIGVDPFVSRELDRHIGDFDTVVVTSRRMAAAFPPQTKLRYVPHGLDLDGTTVGASPYGEGIHAVSVGSMLFDPGFFEAAAPRFPQVAFHVIGGGRGAETLKFPNVKVYSEMPYAATLAYLKYARFGIAPYDGNASDYLCDTSMKLMQYGYFGIPAVCPQVAAGNHPGRFGYRPGDAASIAQAIERALAAEKRVQPGLLSWAQVTDRILRPNEFADTAVAA